MGKGKSLSVEEKSKIEAYKDSGLSISGISKKISRSRKVISAFLSNKSQYGKNNKGGNNRVISNADRRAILRTASNSHDSTSKIRAKVNVKASLSTIQRVIRKATVNHPEGGILPYVCDICLKPIATRAMLKNHIRLYHTTTGFEKKCFVCDKTFTHLAALRNHADTHASERNYACQWCPEKFFASNMLSRHRKKVHPKEYAEWKQQQYVQM